VSPSSSDVTGVDAVALGLALRAHELAGNRDLKAKRASLAE